MRLWLALVLFALAVFATRGAAAQVPPAGQSEAYDQGAADWRDLQAWVDAQTGDRRAGVDYWAASRNDPNHKSCGDAANGYSAGDKVAFIAGCQEAKRRLDPIDVRRADTRYRAGFSDAVKQFSIAANPTPPAAQSPSSGPNLVPGLQPLAPPSPAPPKAEPASKPPASSTGALVIWVAGIALASVGVILAAQLTYSRYRAGKLTGSPAPAVASGITHELVRDKLSSIDQKSESPTRPRAQGLYGRVKSQKQTRRPAA
jgi:hypothetical protein